MDEAVNNYINSHSQHPETVHVDAGALGLNIQNDPEGRLVTVMHPHPLPQLCRQISVSEQDGPWNEELDGKLAALVAQLAQHSRISHHQTHGHHKVTSVRDVESTVILDTPLRHYNSQPLDQPDARSAVEVNLAPLPSLQDMKRCPSDWFHSKTKGTLKETQLLDDEGVLELNPGSSPAQHKQNKKSLPHKKRISRKLKRNTVVNSPQEDNIVEISCADDVQHEEILPDNFVSSVHPVHHITQEVRPVLICQICGDFYGEEQLKFYQHLKQHYEPHATIIIENPVSDQMANSCIVDNVAPIPDSIVELTLENSLPKTTMYQPIDKNYALYTTTSEKLSFNKVQYTMASDKDVGVDDEKDMYETLEKIELYSCTRCNRSFRRQKNCEQHIKEVHCKQMEEINEFSEPEDLMAGIHVSVDEHGEQYEQTLLPHLTVDSGHIHQEHHNKHWYNRSHSSSSSNNGGCTGDGYCPLCVPRTDSAHHNLKEEIIQRIFDAEVSRCDSGELLVAEGELPDVGTLPDVIQQPPSPTQPSSRHDQRGDRREGSEQVLETEDSQENKVCVDKTYDVIEINEGNKKSKIYSCNECPRHFNHRNSVLYHKKSHKNQKPHVCNVCEKGFYTTSALKIHMRVHNDIRPYKCDECGREFRQWGDLKYHVASLHSDKKNFKCDFCGKEFARKYSLNLHRRIHTGEKNYKCELCNKSFRASSYRLTHMRTHTGYKPHNCPICNKAFRVSADVRRHLLTHERAKQRQEAQEKQAKEKLEAENKPETPKTEIKLELTDQPNILDTEKIKAVKKIATASTTRPPLILKGGPKKPKAEKVKRVTIKRGAPNVVITNNKEDVLPKNLNVSDYNHKKTKINSLDFQKHSDSVQSEQSNENRQFAVLKPIPRTDRTDTEKVFINPPNTDGKMTVFTHVETSREPNGAIGSHIDINDLSQNIEIRENRGEIPGEGNESGFIERLTALYNIPAV